MYHPKLVILFLRLSIASVFLYAAIAATVQPYNWIGFLPQFLTVLAPAGVLLTGFSLFQLLLALWLLSGWRSLYASLLASLTLLAIITANWGDLDILFRDFAIFFASLALAAASFESKNQKTKS